jgi:hypothetical protein
VVDARAVSVTADEQLLAYATGAIAVVHSLATGSAVRELTAPATIELYELRFTTDRHWLLARSESGGVIAFDLSTSSSTGEATPIQVGLESPEFRAAQVLRSDLTTLDGQLLRRQAQSLGLARASSATRSGQASTFAASPGALVFGLRSDGRYLLEALATGDVIVRDLELRSARLVPNPVGHPRQIAWLPCGDAMLFGAAGAALLRPTDLRLLRMEALADSRGGLAPFIFDPQTAQYAGYVEAVRRVRLPFVADSVSASPVAVSDLVAEFLK